MYRTQGQQYELAQGDYGMLSGEAQFQTELSQKGFDQKRQMILDQLQLSIDRAKTKEEKARWQKEYDLQNKKFKEEQKQFKEKMAFDKAEAAKPRSSGGGSSSKPSAQEVRTDIVGRIKTNLQSNAGSDRKVHPDDYKAARSDWVTAGYSRDEFDDIFGIFRNTSHLSEYN
jgi:hypothetical protein